MDPFNPDALSWLEDDLDSPNESDHHMESDEDIGIDQTPSMNSADDIEDDPNAHEDAINLGRQVDETGDDHHEADNPRRDPTIDITEMVEGDDDIDIDPANSGFRDGHQPSEFETRLLQGKQYLHWADFNRAVDDYEAKAGWSFKRVARNTNRFIGKCRGFDKKDPNSCKAELYARHLKGSGRVSIQRSNLIHTCSQAVHRFQHGAHKRRWVEDKVESTVRVNPDTSIKDLRGQLRENHSADTTKWTSQRARQRVVKKLGGDQESSFKMIPSYVAKVRASDPRTHIHYETYTSDQRFRRIYMAPASSQHAFNHVRPFVGIDATHSGGEFPMIILLATTFDCNNHILLLAWAVVGVENKDNWEWYMRLLDASYPRMRACPTTVIVSDRDKGLIPAVQRVWEGMHHSFCTRHIRGNVITHSDKALGDWFLQLARQVRLVDFERMLEEYDPTTRRQEAGIEYIRNIDPKLYARHAFPVPRWGHTTSNVVEMLNGVIRPIRKRPTLIICKELWDYTMSKHYERAKTAATWPTGENALTHHASIMLNVLYSRAGGVEERPSSATAALMCDSSGEWSLDMDLRTCECKDWEEMGFPCVHAVKFCRNHDLDEKCYIDSIWKATSQVQAYSVNLPPISLDSVEKDPNCLAPLVVLSEKKAKRSLKRAASRYEKRMATERLAVKQHQKCSICKEEGHNKRGCAVPHQSAQIRMNKSSDYLRVCAIHTLQREQVQTQWLIWDSRPTPKVSFSQWYEEMYSSQDVNNQEQEG